VCFAPLHGGFPAFLTGHSLMRCLTE
jgi:hypothetical protein